MTVAAVAHVRDWDDPSKPVPVSVGPYACRCGQSRWATETPAVAQYFAPYRSIDEWEAMRQSEPWPPTLH